MTSIAPVKCSTDTRYRVAAKTPTGKDARGNDTHGRFSINERSQTQANNVKTRIEVIFENRLLAGALLRRESKSTRWESNIGKHCEVSFSRLLGSKNCSDKKIRFEVRSQPVDCVTEPGVPALFEPPEYRLGRDSGH